MHSIASRLAIEILLALRLIYLSSNEMKTLAEKWVPFSSDASKRHETTDGAP